MDKFRTAFMGAVLAGLPQIPESYKPSWDEPDRPKEEESLPKPANRHERRALASKKRRA